MRNVDAPRSPLAGRDASVNTSRMPSPRPSTAASPPPGPNDDYLIDNMLAGDAGALRALMNRYDRLVRYTVFKVSNDRSRRDPEWVESIASLTWTGFVKSLQRHPDRRPTSVRAYLVQIARNQVVSALRRQPDDGKVVSLDAGDATRDIASTLDEPVETLERLEHLEALKSCCAGLDADDRSLTAELSTIMERRWRDAAEALGMKESTLRSRWGRVLDRLRDCVRQKLGKSFALDGDSGD